jgi:hypothetical protein
LVLRCFRAFFGFLDRLGVAAGRAAGGLAAGVAAASGEAVQSSNAAAAIVATFKSFFT